MWKNQERVDPGNQMKGFQERGSDHMGHLRLKGE